ncbi:MAG: hypothetical protein ED556_00715 [Winogradskyella sp.]|uniref:hypothetical protein n=1 Tax=Winogradskyella sp. TaxID=1883156 RepID=UPI000F3C1308|nr:hypothetical protein [Winogradskyella sp.]RNC87744.1 MAG: hypothetical protein ED556_00715 [Winogradskyella sp.]
MSEYLKYNISFYQNLGKLFYAIAAADKVVKAEELTKLQELIENDLLTSHIVNAESKADAQNAIINTFVWLDNDNEYNAEACYNSFVSFLDENRALFSNEINSVIMKIAGKISSSFSGQNKSELIMLAKLNLELKKQHAD